MYFQAFYIFLSDSYGGCLRKSSRHLTGSYPKVINLSKKNWARWKEEKGQKRNRTDALTHTHTLVKGKQTKTKTGCQRDILCPEHGGHRQCPAWAASTAKSARGPFCHRTQRKVGKESFSMTLSIIYLLFPQHLWPKNLLGWFRWKNRPTWLLTTSQPLFTALQSDFCSQSSTKVGYWSPVTMELPYTVITFATLFKIFFNSAFLCIYSF